MSFKHCSELPLAPRFCASLLPPWASAKLTYFPVTQILPLGLQCTCLPCPQCFCSIFTRSIPHLSGISPETLVSRAASHPTVDPPGAQRLYCSSARWSTDCFFTPGTFSRDCTLPESRNYVFLNSVASPVASILAAWKLEGSQ